MRRKLPEGAKVKFHHKRTYDHEVPLLVLPRGGTTECIVTLADGTTTTGESRCSAKDNYSKRIGRDISLGRALANLERRTP